MGARARARLSTRSPEHVRARARSRSCAGMRPQASVCLPRLRGSAHHTRSVGPCAIPLVFEPGPEKIAKIFPNWPKRLDWAVSVWYHDGMANVRTDRPKRVRRSLYERAIDIAWRKLGCELSYRESYDDEVDAWSTYLYATNPESGETVRVSDGNDLDDAAFSFISRMRDPQFVARARKRLGWVPRRREKKDKVSDLEFAQQVFPDLVPRLQGGGE